MSEEKEWFNDFPKIPRLTILPWLLWALILGISIGAILYATPIRAQGVPVYVAEHQAAKMQLYASRCIDQQSSLMIATAPPQFQDGWKALSSQWLLQSGEWREYAGCWLEIDKNKVGTPENVMLLVFSDGAVVQALKSELLKKGPGA
jgi:hypothetical protein